MRGEEEVIGDSASAIDNLRLRDAGVPGSDEGESTWILRNRKLLFTFNVKKMLIKENRGKGSALNEVKVLGWEEFKGFVTTVHMYYGLKKRDVQGGRGQ